MSDTSTCLTENICVTGREVFATENQDGRFPGSTMCCSGQRFIGQTETQNNYNSPFTQINQQPCTVQGATQNESDFHKQAELQHIKKRPLLFTQRETTVIETNKPKFRAYQRYEIRVESFLGWVSICLLPTWMFAKAGFFYKGFADIAACFQCGLMHKKWQQGDDPIQIHLQLKPSCHYITELLNQGIRSCRDLQASNCENDVEITEVTMGTHNLSISTQLPPNEHLSCKVCLVNRLEMVISPCGHLATCESCCNRLRYSNQKCPICRGEIQDVIKTYIAQ